MSFWRTILTNIFSLISLFFSVVLLNSSGYNKTFVTLSLIFAVIGVLRKELTQLSLTALIFPLALALIVMIPFHDVDVDLSRVSSALEDVAAAIRGTVIP